MSDVTKSLPEAPSKRAYLVHKLKTEITVAMLGNKVDLPVKDLADGCVGVSLWFDTMEHAVEYGGADAEYSQGEVIGLKLKAQDIKKKGNSKSPNPAGISKEGEDL